MFSSNDLRLLRYSRQVKQRLMAHKMGITKQRYSQLENHKTLPVERQKEILALLGYTVKSAKRYLGGIPKSPALRS